MEGLLFGGDAAVSSRRGFNLGGGSGRLAGVLEDEEGRFVVPVAQVHLRPGAKDRGELVEGLVGELGGFVEEEVRVIEVVVVLLVEVGEGDPELGGLADGLGGVNS